MRQVIYTTESNYYAASSLRELRNHVQFFNNVHQRNPYDGDCVLRYIRRGSDWECDYSFRAQINVVKGRVVLRRVKVPSIPVDGFPV